MAKKIFKRFKDISVISARSGICHAVRNRQTEYEGKKRRNVIVLETYCGRHVEGSRSITAGKVDCQTCISGINA